MADDARGRWILSTDPEATEALGRAIGEALRAGDVVALRGEMGTGKTCLVRGIAVGLGVEGEVSSPSFTLMQEYEGRLPLYHFDAWMTRREVGFLEGGGADYLGGEGVAVIEWAERVEAWLPGSHLRVELEHRGADRRRIRMTWVGPEGANGADRIVLPVHPDLRPENGAASEPPPESPVRRGP